MKTRITTKPKRCLKFEGYIYLPDDTSNFNDLRYHTSRRMGRLIIYNQFGERMTEKGIAFDTLGKLLNEIEQVFKKLVYKRVKRK